MAWVIWHEDNGRREYLRRVTPQFVSWTVNREDARRFPTRADARAAIKGRGMSALREGTPPYRGIGSVLLSGADDDGG